MNANFGLNYNAWHNIEQLANCSDSGKIVCINQQEIEIDTISHEKNQNKEEIALILRRSLSDFSTIINRSRNKQFALSEANPTNESLEGIFKRAIQNYQLFGFDKIIPLDLQASQISEFDIHLLEERESAAKQDLKQLEVAFENANNPSLNSFVRATYMPQMTGAMTANGTYYVYGDKLSDSKSSSVERLFIAKPALQEAGASKSPQHHPQTRDGIKGGEGVFRERIVYTGQSLLKIDCGIPPTFVIQGTNSFLSSEVNFGKITECLESIKKVNPKIDLPSFINLIKKGTSLAEMINVINFQDVSLLSPFEQRVYTFIDAQRQEGAKVSYALLVRELRNHYPMSEIQSQVSLLKEILEKNEALGSLQEAIETLWSQVLLTTEQPGVMSVQKYVSGCQSLGWWLAHYDQNNLSDEEVHRLIIDLIFFNTDRHLSNILVDMSSSTPKLVLIDHGSCLPNPLGEEDGKGLKQARYEFLELPHCNKVLHPKYANIIKDLNIESYIESLKKDQKSHEENFGSICHIHEDCYQLIRLNLHLIKVGTEIGATVKEMGSMHQITNPTQSSNTGGEIVGIYLKYIYNKDQIDWDLVKNEIKAVLISKRM